MNKGLWMGACLAAWAGLAPVWAWDGPNAEETALASMITTDPGQGRPSMTYSPTLNMVARYRAKSLATRGYFAHVDPDGYGANVHVRFAYYALPEYWGTNKADNYLESIAAGYATAAATFAGWMASAPHKQHVLAEIDFYKAETDYGVGYYYLAGSDYVHYWTFISAPPDPAASLTPYTEWKFDRLTAAQMDTPDPDGDGLPTLFEYVVDFNPLTVSTGSCFTFTYNRALTRGEVTIPIRADLDPMVQVYVQTATNLVPSVWTTNGVQRVGNTFSAGAAPDISRFFNIKAAR